MEVWRLAIEACKVSPWRSGWRLSELWKPSLKTVRLEAQWSWRLTEVTYILSGGLFHGVKVHGSTWSPGWASITPGVSIHNSRVAARLQREFFWFYRVRTLYSRVTISNSGVSLQDSWVSLYSLKVVLHCLKGAHWPTTEKVSLHDFKCEPPGTPGAEPPWLQVSTLHDSPV